jgi:hypothetical protein
MSDVTNTSKIGKTANSVPEVMVFPKQAPGSNMKKPVKPGKPSQFKTKELVVPILHNQSPIGKISDLLDKLPLNSCVTHRIFTTI